MSRKYLPSRHFIIASVLLVALLAIIVNWGTPRAAAVGSSTNPVTAAWEKARAAGSYHFDSNVLQVTIPKATVLNVGRSSRTEQFHLTGQSDLRTNSLQMEFWSEGGNLLQSASSTAIKVENGKTYVRKPTVTGGGDWQETESMTAPGGHPLAPQGDFMAYLQAVRNLQPHAPETRGPSGRGITFTRYSFTLDGPTFAAYVHQQMESALRAKGELPPGVQIEAPAYYRQMSGEGELWVGSDGLPLRQILELRFPEQRNETIHTQLTVDFSRFGTPQRTLAELWQAGDTSGVVDAIARHLPSPAALSVLLPVVLPLLLLTALVVYYRRARALHIALTTTVIASLVIGPLLTTLQLETFFQAQTAKAAAQEEQQATIDQQRELRDTLGRPEFDPHLSPMRNAELGTRNVESVVIDHHSALQTPHSALQTSDTGIDSDSDGLSDFVEERVDTALDLPDSDDDGIPDKVEVTGFALGGKTWYLNAREEDSNGDSTLDGLECWNAIPDSQTPPSQMPPCDRDTDGDGNPDLFDEDNDNDGVSDRKDLAPFTRFQGTAAGFSESSPFQLKLSNLTADKPTFVEFQLRPQDTDHLWFAFNVLDWPQDRLGQVRDVDGKSFADVIVPNQTGPALPVNEANGDLKLIPMLELRIPDNGANLPAQADLTPYNISLKAFATGVTAAYVPLNLVTDEQTSERMAFSGRMRYQASGLWPNAHEVRLVWVAQVLNDQPCDPNDAAPGGPPVAAGCAADGYIHNVLQPVVAYYDDFTLTGLNVREDHGASIAIVYEDPAVDTDKKHDAELGLLSQGLNESFLTGRDQDNNGQRDVDLSEIVRRFDRNQNGGVGERDRWAIPNTLQVERQNYPIYDQAIMFTAMTETVRVLNSNFAPHWQADNALKPLLLFADEQQYRSFSLDGMTGLTGNGLDINFSPGGQPLELMTMAGLRAMPYCSAAGPTPSWDACAVDVTTTSPFTPWIGKVTC